MIIILIGYMGSGKSTIGQKLSNINGFDFIDLDSFIEKKEVTTVSELFKSKGEIYFRKIESQYLKEVLQFNNNTVLALGGGTPCYGANMETILNHTNVKSVYLKASIPQLVERLEKEKSKRPLIAHLKSSEALVEFIGKHLFERSIFYNQSHVIISVDNKTIDDIVDAIVMELF
ncbi:MAG: AAA family ATPase [Gelidibacter sp.]|nr:AAA family ATPase [Gelidibacter sp.]